MKIHIFMYYDLILHIYSIPILQNPARNLHSKRFPYRNQTRTETYRKVKYLAVFRAIEWELHQEQYRFGILPVAPSWTIRDINTTVLLWPHWS